MTFTLKEKDGADRLWNVIKLRQWFPRADKDSPKITSAWEWFVKRCRENAALVEWRRWTAAPSYLMTKHLADCSCAVMELL